MRPGPDEKTINSPAFRWRGTDGTELTAYRIPYDYSTRGGHEDDVIRKRTGDLLAQSAARGIPLMAFFGVGDHGAGPPGSPCGRSTPCGTNTTGRWTSAIPSATSVRSRTRPRGPTRCPR